MKYVTIIALGLKLPLRIDIISVYHARCIPDIHYYYGIIETLIYIEQNGAHLRNQKCI